MNIAVVGLGLIGGSFAKATKQRTLHNVYGYDTDDEVQLFARLTGAIDAKLTDEILTECDLVIVALLPGAAVKWIEEKAEILGKGKCTVIDICGVKRNICKVLSQCAKENSFNYIGGHPMAGKEIGGFVNSSENLFENASMILTPTEKYDIKFLESIQNYFLDIGFSNITFATPEEHDRVIAFTSQLAHIVSGAYVKSPTAKQQRGFSAGSFKDMTRVARLDENMWTELMMENKDYLAQELRIVIDNLKEYLDALESKDSQALCKCLKEGKIAKAQAGGN